MQQPSSPEVHYQSHVSDNVEVQAIYPDTSCRLTEESSVSLPGQADRVLDGTCVAASYSSPEYFISSVSTAPMSQPGLLYCPMPWPDDMLASPRRQFLWQYFLHTIKSSALCLDLQDVNRLAPGFQDPFVVTLPQMAFASSGLRGAVLYFSMFQYKALDSQRHLESAMNVAWREASQSLQAHIAELHQDDGGSIMAAISACCILSWCAPARRQDYLHLAVRMVVTFLEKSRRWDNIPDTFREVVLTSFRWTTISSLCSLRPPSKILNNKICKLIGLDSHETSRNFSTEFSTWISHPIFAFSLRLVNPLLRMGQLAQLQLSRHSEEHEDGEDCDDALEGRISALEDMLLNARALDVDATASFLGPTDPPGLLLLNEAMHACCVILFYTRFRGVPFTGPLIRGQVQIVADEISKVRSDSRVLYASVFPLFIAGCEAVDSAARKVIAEGLRHPKGLFFDRGDIVAALQHIWQIRDNHPGLTWPDWVKYGKMFSAPSSFLRASQKYCPNDCETKLMPVDPQFRISNLF